jgi:hypothetical protein
MSLRRLITEIALSRAASLDAVSKDSASACDRIVSHSGDILYAAVIDKANFR